MKHGAWHGVLPGLVILICPGIHAAEPRSQLAFLRAVPQAETGAKRETSRPAPRMPDHAARRFLADEDFYDPKNPDLRHLQRYGDAMADLPLDANGFPDWMRALRQSKIKPWAAMKPDAAMGTLDLDVVMKNTREMPFVRFPHYAHTLWLDCSNCHPVPFAAKTGATLIAMADIFRGKHCGMCHDRVAFVTFFSCQRCHSVPQAGTALPR